MYKRTDTKKVKIGKLVIGGGSPVLVQSMANTETTDVRATVSQIKKLQDAGCEIVRVAVPDMESAKCLGKIKAGIKIPLVADIHFDYRLALEAIEQGVDKLRLNPGNIGSLDKVALVAEKAKKAGIPIRIGVNAGSLPEVHKNKHLSAAETAKKLVDAAFKHIKLLEQHKFYDIAVSLKASDVTTTVEAYRLFASRSNYPLHLGITEAGSIFSGTIKSSVGMGILLSMGLGDTVRVSLTADPVEEVKVAYQVLQALHIRSTGIELVSCPTCARCEVDLIKIVSELEVKLSLLNPLTSKLFSKRPLKIAVMGCVVNGPGEAKEADFGIAGGKKSGLLFKSGKVAGRVEPGKWVSTLIGLVKNKVLRGKRGKG